MKNKDRIIFKRIKVKNLEDFHFLDNIKIFLNKKNHETIMDYGKRGARHYSCKSFHGRRLEGIEIHFKNLG